MPEPKDAELAIELLARAGWVRRLARTLTRSAADAEDLVQDAGEEVLRRPPETVRSWRAWLGGVLRHGAQRQRHRAVAREARERVAARPESGPPAAELVERAALLREIVKAVEELDEPYRSTVLLRFVEERSPSQIARKLGIPAGTVRARLTRGLAQLRARFRRSHGADWIACLAPFALKPILASVLPGGGAAVGGALMAKKLIAAAAILILVLGGAWVASRGPASRTTGGRHAPDTAATIGNPAPDGAGPSIEAVPLRDPAAGAGSARVLDPEVAMNGRVVDATGQPVPGARVSWSATLRGVLVERSATTAEDGGFLLANLPARSSLAGGERPVIEAAHPRFAATTLWVSALASWCADPTASVELVLGAGLRVRGRVSDAETGVAIAGARVAARLSANAAADELRARGADPDVGAVTATDAEGRYELSRIPVPGLHDWDHTLPRGELGRLDVKAEGHARASNVLPIRGDGEEVVIDVRLWRSAVVTGRVVDRRGRPQAGASVWAHAPEIEDANASTTTDAGGRYRLDGVPALTGADRRVVVYVNPAGTNRLSPGFSSHEKRELRLRAGSEDEMEDFVLDPLPSALVHVVDAQGRPIGGASSGHPLHAMLAPTDAEGRGRVVFAPETAGKSIRLVLRAPGFAPALTPEVVPDELEPPTIEVVMQAGASVSGVVRWEDGTPAAGVSVSVADASVAPETAFSDKGPGRPNDDPWSDGFHSYVWTTVTTATDGSFRAGALPPGLYHLCAAGEARAVANEVAPGTTGVELRLGSKPRVVALCGSVSDRETGAPVGVFEVQVAGAREGVRPERVGLGRFLVRLPSPGPWKLRVVAQGWVSEEREVDVEAEAVSEVRFELERGATVRGVLRAPEDSDLYRYRVLLSSEGNPSVEATIAADGSFEAKGVRPGVHGILLLAPNFGPWVTRPLVVAEHDSVEIRPLDSLVRMERRVEVGGWLQGTVVLPAADRKTRVTVTLRDARGAVAWTFTAWSTMGFTYALAAGPYAARVEREGVLLAEGSVDIRAGEKTRLTLTCR